MDQDAGSSKNVAEKCTAESQNKETSVGGIFKCHLCQMDEQYDYFGAQPHFAKHIIYDENCYIKKDPFSPTNKGEVLVLGGNCSMCKSQVCMSCSLFYSNRLCAICCNKFKNQLPQVLHTKIKKLFESMQSGAQNL